MVKSQIEYGSNSNTLGFKLVEAMSVILLGILVLAFIVWWFFRDST